MYGQQIMGFDGHITDKVAMAIQRLKAFEPPEGYYVAFSGGKDSQCVYHLCQMAEVEFDAHYSVTSVDPPELVRFIKRNYPDVEFRIPHDKDGKPVTMWNLIRENKLLPTRMARFCCADLKETGGGGRVVVTGVRWAESYRRKQTRGIVNVYGKPKTTAKLAEETLTSYRMAQNGGLIMNDDNDAARRMVEQCYRTQKTMVNPIVDWTDDDVWGFLNGSGIEHCCLYDEGFTRIGCIGCPLAGGNTMKKDFVRWPKYQDSYMRAITRALEAGGFEKWLGKHSELQNATVKKKAEALFDWWLKERIN